MGDKATPSGEPPSGEDGWQPEGLPPSSVVTRNGVPASEPVSDVESLMAALSRDNKKPIEADRIGGEQFLTLEALVEEINEHPPDGRFEHRGTFETVGFIPLVYNAAENEVLLGIRYHRDNSAEIREPVEISMSLEMQVMPYDGIDGMNVRYLLLENKEYQQLQQLVTDGKKRRQFLHEQLDEINLDTTARMAFYAMLRHAIHKRATDIHLEPLKDGQNRVRYRVDGVLVTTDYKLTRQMLRHIITLVKNDGKMKIEESRRPQDGSIAFDERMLKEQPLFDGYSLRLSTMPTNNGEKMAIRILKAEEQYFDLKQLGYPEAVYRNIVDMSATPYGLILVTGPTGSGKTTTLYSVLQHLNKPDVNIVTIEDPIEIDLDGINQSQVNRAIDWDFGNMLRTYLRQDPDVILVGEIRDTETAKAAMEAAKTGHLVFSTVHTNDSISTLLRLYELGVESSDLQSCLTAVISQRLTRVLCPECKVGYDAKDELNDLLGQEVFREPVNLYRESGDKHCSHCSGLGYRGRIVVPELWILGDQERDLIAQGCRSYTQYHGIAIAGGMTTLMRSAMDIVMTGRTSLDEVMRTVVSRREFMKNTEMVAQIVNGYAGK